MSQPSVGALLTLKGPVTDLSVKQMMISGSWSRGGRVPKTTCGPRGEGKGGREGGRGGCSEHKRGGKEEHGVPQTEGIERG